MRNLPFAIAGCLHGFPVKTMGLVSNSRKFKSTIIICHCSFNRRYAKPKSIRHILNTWIYLFLKVIRWGTRCQKRAPVDSAGDK
jgi:hypothetical protein